MDNQIELYDEVKEMMVALENPEVPSWYKDAVFHRVSWLSTARPEQLPPKGEHHQFLYLAGRGAGKTRTCAEEVFWYAIRHPGVRIGVIAPTLGDLKKVCFEGESGLVGVRGEGNGPDNPKNGVVPASCIQDYLSSEYYLRLKNGSIFQGFSSDAQERIRGNQFHKLWCEEMCAWENIEETFDQASFALRLFEDNNGVETDSVIVISTTPKPLKFLKAMIKDPNTLMTTGSTYDNAANLSKMSLKRFTKFEGTEKGKQELYGEVLDFSTSAPLKRAYWLPWDKPLPNLEKITISCDTAMKPGKRSDSSACTVWATVRINKRYWEKHPDMGFDVQKTKRDWAIILIDSWREKLEYPDLKTKILGTYNKYKKILDGLGTIDDQPDIELLIEDKQSGTSLIQELRRVDIDVISFNPHLSSKIKDQKRERADMASDAFVNGKIYAMGRKLDTGNIVFNGSQYKKESDERWNNTVEAVITQCEEFTGLETGEADVDDYVDTVSQAIQHLRDSGYIDIDIDVNYHPKDSREEEREHEDRNYSPPESLYG